MSKSIVLQSKQVSANLSIVVTTQDDKLRLFVIPLLSLTTLFFWFWRLTEIVQIIGIGYRILTEQLIYTLEVWFKVTSIVFNSLGYGILQL